MSSENFHWMVKPVIVLMYTKIVLHLYCLVTYIVLWITLTCTNKAWLFDWSYQISFYGRLALLKFCEYMYNTWAVTVTDPPQALLDEVQLLFRVNGQQISSHHLTGQRDRVPVKGLLDQQVLSPTVKHPGLVLCGGARRIIITQDTF